jgi:hypothetical protein
VCEGERKFVRVSVRVCEREFQLEIACVRERGCVRV